MMHHPSKELCDALDWLAAGSQAPSSGRSLALEMWRRVAENPADEESICWARAVAERILAEDRQPDSRDRPVKIMAAVGLAGTEDRWRVVREALAVFRMMKNLPSGDGMPDPIPKRGELMDQEIAFLYDRFPEIFGESPEEGWDEHRIRKLIEREMPKRSP